MTVLVTGAAGFIGNHVVRALLRGGRDVRASVHNLEKAHQRLGDLAGRIEIVRGDVTSRESMDAAVAGVEAIVHLVAIPMERGGRQYDSINYRGTVNLVDAARAAGVKRFVNMAQNGSAPDHFSRFLRSKGNAEVYVAESGLDWTSIRPSVVFGPEDEFFNAFARLIRLTPVVFPLIGGGKARFQPVSVYDVADIVVRSLDDPTTVGRDFAVGGPEVLNLEQIEKRVLEAMNTRRILIPVPVPLLRPVVWVMERTLPGTPVNSTLLDLLKEPNTTPQNDAVDFFHLDLKPFAGENITYLRRNTISNALTVLFTGKTVH